MNTIAEYALKTGSDIGDLTSTDIMDVIIYPALDRAINVCFGVLYGLEIRKPKTQILPDK